MVVIDYQSVREDFITWFKGKGICWENYGKQLVRHLEHFAKPISKPMDLVELFSGLNNSQKRHLVNGLRNLFKFYETQGLASKQWLDLLRSNLPRISIGVDLNVPSEKEIVDSLKKLAKKDKTKRVFAIYNLLLDSGLRLTEAVKLYNALKFENVKIEKSNGFYIVPLGYFRNTKTAYYGFITDYTMKAIKKAQGNPLNYKKINGTATKRFGVVAYKYLRKFAFDTMTNEKLNIPESVADFIEGRTPKSVGARHYMKLKRKSIQFYPRYAEYLKELRAKAKLK